MSHNLEFVIEGLCCANCAAKIEGKVGELGEIKSHSLNFMMRKLNVELLDKKTEKEVTSKIKDIVKKIEPDAKVLLVEHEHNHEHEHEHEHDSEFSKIKLARFGVGAILFATGLLTNFGSTAELGIFLAAYLLIGGDVVLSAVKNILRGQVFDENFLMTIATVGAFAIGEYPEGVAVMLFYQIGELFQDKAVSNSRKSIKSLLGLRPDYANLKVGSGDKKVNPEEIKVGDIIIIKPGERVPLDGKVIQGDSTVDTSALTGESLPRSVSVDSEVLSGFINKNGVLTVEVLKTFGDSTVAKILDLVQNASSKKAQTEKFITKFARYYTPAVVIFAALLAFVPPLIIPDAAFSDWIYRALIFLVISCPCALVISIPLGFFGGIGAASKNGILIKGSNYLEALNSVSTVVFDKTGTLTKGIFKVTKIVNKGEISEQEFLKTVAFAESYSNHPIAQSILKAYGKEVELSSIQNYNEISGLGVSANVFGRNVLAGNATLMLNQKIPFDAVDTVGTVVHMAIDSVYAGYIVISDEIKEGTQNALAELKKLSIKKLVMLTGDNRNVAEKVGKELLLDEIHAELLPHQKVEKLEKIQKEIPPKTKLIFVGDGINDAPVLARADIGVAMGGLGSDAAIEAADIVLMTDEPKKLVTAIKIANRTRVIVWQNIIFAIGVKLLVLALGAMGLATMWEAVFADVGVAVIAILNAMRVMKIKE